MGSQLARLAPQRLQLHLHLGARLFAGLEHVSVPPPGGQRLWLLLLLLADACVQWVHQHCWGLESLVELLRLAGSGTSKSKPLTFLQRCELVLHAPPFKLRMVRATTRSRSGCLGERAHRLGPS